MFRTTGMSAPRSNPSHPSFQRTMTFSRQDFRPYALLLLVFLCSAVAYYPSVYSGFLNWDDTFLILANPSVRVLNPEAIVNWFSTFHVNHYHPLLLATFAVEHAIFGPAPMPFHITNLFLHGLNAVLVFLLLSRFVADRVALTLAVLLFALHPLRVEAVAWVSARKDLLSTLFILLSVIAFLRYVDLRKPGDMAWSLAAAILASLSKAIGAVIPFLLLASLFTFPEHRRRGCYRSLVPFIILATLTAGVAARAQYSSEPSSIDPTSSLLRSITLPFGNLLFYAWKTIYPAGLSAVYPFPEQGGPNLLALSLTGMLLTFVSFVLLIRVRWKPAVAFALVWVVVSLLPILQIIPVGRSFAADRYTYLPAIGLSLLAGLFLGESVARREGFYKPVVRRAGIVILAFLGTLSFIRTEVWNRSTALWMDVLSQYPEFAEGYVYLGSALATEDLNEEAAILAFTESIRLDGKNPYAYSNRALASLQVPSSDSAKILSDISTAVSLDPEDADLRFFLAETHDRFGRFSEAFLETTELLDRNPSFHRARLLRIRSALALGDDESVQVDIAYLTHMGIEVTLEGLDGKGVQEPR